MYRAVITLKNKTALQKIIFIVTGMLCISPVISSPVALTLGIVLALWIHHPFEKYLHKYIQRLLQFSIVGLGFGLPLEQALQAGKTGLYLTAISIAAVAGVGFLLGKLLKTEQPLSYLLTVGTAVCGGSAIAAVAPIVQPNTKQLSIALAIIFSLNAVALFVYPLVGHWLQLSQEQFGLWCAIGIHDTSAVIGAANKYGHEALQTATTVKLARALWIIPVCLVTVVVYSNKKARIKIPWFIGCFIIAILLPHYFPVFQEVSAAITTVSKSGLNLTLFLIGSTLSVSTLRSISWKPLVFAILLWLAISAGSLWYIAR